MFLQQGFEPDLGAMNSVLWDLYHRKPGAKFFTLLLCFKPLPEHQPTSEHHPPLLRSTEPHR